ncbi:hypothetical protein NIIDMKKI_45690 [Mycobacterium kansasii]|uniref:Uncharacterized protein n=1 Tax=Mycobacterium kansasii TaxID=1768 RepID=A0A7G1IGS2_MYCKA|nr:hypothetical protein NIIDMKKI_45690 [Mycobacterium kansasii]
MRIDDPEPVLGGDGQHRNTFVQCGDHSRQQVRRAGAGIAQHSRDLSRRLVQSLGHVHPGRFVAHRHQPDTVGLQLREKRIDLRGRQPEEELDPLGLKRTGEELAAGHLGHLNLPSVSRSSMDRTTGAPVGRRG